MARGNRKKNRTRKPPTPAPDAQGASPTAPVNPTGSVTVVDIPLPEMLAEMARGEVDRGLLEDYRETIQILRDDKRFSFREIAEWLNSHGIEVDRNAVYRAYCKRLSDSEAIQEDIEDQEREGES
jgi:hypothetical protein